MDFPITMDPGTRAVRLVSTGRLRDPVLHLLLNDPDAAKIPAAEREQQAKELAEIEGATSARLTAQAALAAVFPSGRPHANFVNAAFTYWLPKQLSRFNDPSFGAWYAGFTTKTSQAEVVFHMTRHLRDTGDFHATVEWSEMWASFAGAFVDLRGLDPAPRCLNPDPALGYPAGVALARQTREAGHNGIIYPSVRDPGGTCLAALWPHAVQSVAQGAIIRAAWTGTESPEVTVVSP